ncbi:MAG: bifunctional UDP-N-acetylglucosamine diphosphorylase/glucosamine-1-phosphate N-acetyltransferase GlmU [Parvularculaceae bacterium]|jgi:bifunctional UDP-N-acetylglucosamine pyrophosphorylase/glucosamine-1-phosphate N-acetyltransferase|nr:bifunctional UDP-N-acetylglucosamine diphosphorylase/glucosamine-1-phosphate N-acetyltransferase GlmU [Parvularculaceae bacterium]
MSPSSTAVVILAAGHGTRMKSATPKVLHEIGGRSMLAHVMATAARFAPKRLAVVIGDQAPEVGDAARRIRPDVAVAVQAPPRGTGDAVRQALPALDGFSGVVLVLYADTPLLTEATLRALASAASGAAGAALGFRPEVPGAYGRLKTAGVDLLGIVEAKDASPDELAIPLCNAGAMAVDADVLRTYVPRLSDNNAKREFYLTDIVGLARADGGRFAVAEADEAEVMGVNSRVELAEAERVFQRRRRREAMENGATLIDPDTVYFSADTEIGADVVIEPHVYFGPKTRIAGGVRICAFSHVEGASAETGSVIGPFARLRPGAELKAKARVGNFVEVKKAVIGEGAKVNHLTYIGDADIGARANIGAGTITCNYDGFSKHRTEIGPDAFIGSNSALVAPVRIGRGAYVGSGSVITKPVEDGALAVARGRQAEIKGWADKFRAANSGKKAHD